MTEPGLLTLWVHIVHERDSSRNITLKPSWRSDVLKRAVSRRGIMPVIDKRRTVSARIRCPISSGQEDNRDRCLWCGGGHGGYDSNHQHCYRSCGYHKQHSSGTPHFALLYTTRLLRLQRGRKPPPGDVGTLD